MKKNYNISKGQVQNVKNNINKPDDSKICKIAPKCGGCLGQKQGYEKSLEKKQKNLNELLKKFGKSEPVIGMENPYHYRNKVHGVVSRDKKGNIFTGVYREGTHFVVPVKECLIENEKADEIMQTICGLLKDFKIKIFDEDTRYGLVRHILVRTAHKSGEIMVTIVTASPVFPSKNNFVKALREAHPEITTIVVNYNDRRTSMVLGDREQVLYGKGYIEDILCGKKFRISSRSFYQVNSVQTEILYKKALEFAGLTGKETIIDAYCGIGTIGIIAGDKVKKVIAVESNRDAVKDAIINKKLNKAENVEFYEKDAGSFMSELAALNVKADVLFMDPPRSGSTEEFMNAVKELKPKKVVYISCNPITLARDLDYMTKGGLYKVKKIQGVDLFPWTGHVEVVCLLSKLQDAKQHIKIMPKMDELYVTGAERKYPQGRIKK